MTLQDTLERLPRNESLFSLEPQLKIMQAGRAVIIVSALALAASVVYATGGTGFAYPYLMLMPIILASAWHGLLASIGCAILGGLLLGPYMPLDVAKGLLQPSHNWLARIVFFITIGVFTSSLFHSLKKANLRQLHVMRIDSSTGLENRTALDEDLRKVLALHRKSGLSDHTVSIILVRMQDLWEILEAMGTDTSDLVVLNLAERIHNSLDAAHRTYRFSTSELAIVFLAKSQQEVDSIAREVIETGEDEAVVNGVPLRVQLAAGSYHVERNVLEAETVVNRARTALFAAIDSTVLYKTYSPSFDQKTSERVKLISKVRTALKKREFELFYQPKISLATGCHVGAEALLRWLNPDGSLVMPGLFMPKLEKTSLIEPVTRFVITRACEDVRHHDLMAVNINFAVKNLMDEALVEELGSMVGSYGVNPGTIEIEITEGALIQEPVHARKAVESLRNQGFKVSLDDFGTGYSSFQYLSNLPLSGLKIDRAFVTHLENSPDARTVMKSMITMAHALQLEVTIEGIETPIQHQIVADLGADYAQGFLFSHALPLQQYLRNL